MTWLIVGIVAFAALSWMYPKAKAINWDKELAPKMRDALMGDPDEKTKNKTP